MQDTLQHIHKENKIDVQISHNYESNSCQPPIMIIFFVIFSQDLAVITKFKI